MDFDCFRFSRVDTHIDINKETYFSISSEYRNLLVNFYYSIIFFYHFTLTDTVLSRLYRTAYSTPVHVRCDVRALWGLELAD